MSQTNDQIIKGPLCRVFLSSLFSSPTFPQKHTHPLSTTLSSHSPQKTPCITSLRAPPALSAVPLRRPLVPFSPVAPTRKLSFPTRAARASSRVSTCLQTLLVLRLDRKVSLSLPRASHLVRVGLLTCRALGRNVIIEQSFGGPKITKGETSFLFAFPLLSVFSAVFVSFSPHRYLYFPKGAYTFSFPHLTVVLFVRTHVGLTYLFVLLCRWCHGCQGNHIEGQV